MTDGLGLHNSGSTVSRWQNATSFCRLPKRFHESLDGPGRMSIAGSIRLRNRTGEFNMILSSAGQPPSGSPPLQVHSRAFAKPHPNRTSTASGAGKNWLSGV
jgi:hypothetical protein